MQNYFTYNAQGNILSSGLSLDGTMPTGAVVCTSSQASDPGQWCVDVSSTPPAVVSAPAAQLAAQALIQSAQTALAAGISIVSSGTPALNATYAVDQLSQMDVIAIETSLNAGKGFPGGVTTFNYQDAGGVMHAFSESNFTDFAAAVRDYVYALKSVIAGSSSTLPAASVTIA
jgi:hypothetical protein